MKSNRMYWVLILALVTLAVCLGHVSAEDAPAAPTYSTAVCSMPDVFQNYVRTQDMLVQLQTIRNALGTEKEAREAKIMESQNQLQELTLGSEASMALAESIEDQVIQLRVWYETEQARARRRHRNLTGAMLATIGTTIGQIAGERGIQVVLNRTNMNLAENPAEQIIQPHVLYAGPDVDITADVITRLNEQYTPTQQPGQ